MTEKEVLSELAVWLKREADHAQQKSNCDDVHSSLQFASEAFAYRQALKELERLKEYLSE